MECKFIGVHIAAIAANRIRVCRYRSNSASVGQHDFMFVFVAVFQIGVIDFLPKDIVQCPQVLFDYPQGMDALSFRRRNDQPVTALAVRRRFKHLFDDLHRANKGFARLPCEHPDFVAGGIFQPGILVVVQPHQRLYGVLFSHRSAQRFPARHRDRCACLFQVWP